MFECALIGYGYWGSKIARYIFESPDFNLKYTCGSKTDLEEIWSDHKVTAVIVATPNDTHYPLTRAALNAGKDVLVEKPLALKTKECEELGDIATKVNKRLMVEYTWTFSRGLGIAQDIVRAGGIEAILGIEMTVRHLGRFGGGSVYWLLGSHMLSVLDMFTPIKDLSFEKTDLVNYKGQVETGRISFGKGDISGQIIISLNYPGKHTEVVLYGERGTIIYNPYLKGSLFVETYERKPWTAAPDLLVRSSLHHIDEANNLRYALSHFAKLLRGEAPSNIARAIAITRILEELTAD